MYTELVVRQDDYRHLLRSDNRQIANLPGGRDKPSINHAYQSQQSNDVEGLGSLPVLLPLLGPLSAEACAGKWGVADGVLRLWTGNTEGVLQNGPRRQKNERLKKETTAFVKTGRREERKTSVSRLRII
jgi:hypothetical protein